MRHPEIRGLRSPSRIAEFPDPALNNSVQLINPGREFLGIGFSGDTFAEFDHPVTIFWGHGG